MRSRAQIGITAGILIAVGVGLTLYKSFRLGFPLVPDSYREVWTIESKIYFEPTSGPVNVSLALPPGEAGWEGSRCMQYQRDAESWG